MLDFLDFFGVVTYVMLGSIAGNVASLSVCGVNLVLTFVYSSLPKSWGFEVIIQCYVRGQKWSFNSMLYKVILIVVINHNCCY